MPSAHILIVDDEPGIRQQLTAVLQDEGYSTRVVAAASEVLPALAKDLFDMVLLDIWLPDGDGLKVLRQLRANGHTLPVVIISGHATTDLAVEAIREGAQDFLEKPLGLERVLVTVRNALGHARLAERLDREREEPAPVLTGGSPAVVKLRMEVMRAGPSDSRVLISGPNGAGKEVVARLLHMQSRRAAGAFVALNCAAIPSDLVESELFGHVKGAFTGAIDNKRGKVELADGGSLFLDEIGDMSLLTQAKLLRFLQESSFMRVGSGHEVRVDVRVIAATNKDLGNEIKEGRFRQDLFYRLSVIPICVPALVERREDIPLLAGEFLSQLARLFGLQPKRLSQEAVERLTGHDWPGNVRELKNVMERLLVMTPEETITPEHLSGLGSPSGYQPGVPIINLRAAREDFERAYISDVVQRCKGNMSQAARLLGLERSHLYRKLRALGSPHR